MNSIKHSLRRHRDIRVLDPQDHDFMKDPGAALSMKTPKGARALLWMVVATLISAIAWASQAHLDEITQGIGKVIPSSQIQVVQSLDGGLVAEILVSEGQIVERGQVMIRIDDTRVASNLQEKDVSTDELRARMVRLRAEAYDTEFNPNNELKSKNPDMMAREKELFESRRLELQNRMNILQSQISQREQELKELDARMSHLREADDLVRRELAVTRPLLRSGAVAQVEILRLERTAVETRAELQATELAIPRVKSQLEEAQRRLVEEEFKFRNDARIEYNRAAAKLAELEASNVALEDRVEHTAVRSPVRGTVNKVWINTVGGVVSPGMNLVEIVPLEDSLLIEAQIRPSDIAFLHPGLEARVKISAYDYLIYGALDAKLEHISADTLRDPVTGSDYYLIRVRTNETTLGASDDPLPIIPGMLAEVDIMTGSKTVLHYMMKPVLRARQNALIER